MTDLIPPQGAGLDFSQITFLKSAPSIDQSPVDSGIEVAFVGRSNAGKSSAINTITRKNGLARTSKTPGRTQLINFFEIDRDRRLVDLPGYGYAKIPKKVQEQIETILSEYLSLRQCLQGIILLMDIRHPLMPADKQFISFAVQRELPVHILLTKCDKLSRGASNNTLLATQRALGAYKGVTAQAFSALTNIGLDEARLKLADWFSFD
jgi:GTP-binding protein